MKFPLPVIYKRVSDTFGFRKNNSFGGTLMRHQAVRIPDKPTFDGSEKIEIVSHYDLFEKTILTDVFQILDYGVLVLVVERIRKIIDYYQRLLVRFFSRLNFKKHI